MAKKLSEIQENVEAATQEFVEYIKRNVDVEVYNLLLKLTNLTEVYIFSGVIRNFFLQKEEIRDLDIVIRHDIDIEKLIHSSISFRRNSFGGYKVNISEINIDLWTLHSTWAVQYQKRLELDDELENLHRFIPSTAFFNFSAVLFSLNENKFYYKTEFLSFLQNKELNYLYTPNASVALCVVNSFYYSDRYNLKISDRLKRYLIELSKTKLDYVDVQIKHFGRVHYSEKEIRQKISNFKLEKRHTSDYITENLDEVFNRLGLNKTNGLYFINEDAWKVETDFPNRVRRLLENDLKPDAFFCFDNKPLILFFENPTKKYELHKAIWNFNECPIAIIIENNIVEIFNGFDFDLKSKLLTKIGKEEKLNDFRYFELVTGKTWEQYSKDLHYRKRVDYNLLQNIKGARKTLVQKNKLDSKVANALIGKAIFVRYLIDRKVKMKFDSERTWSNEEFCDLLDEPSKIKAFFSYLEDSDRGFNSNLFPLTDNEYDQISTSDFETVKKLLQGEDIVTGQRSLFNFYDFSIIPIEFISNVYELFIGQDNQKKEGAYYTPLFLVDYILKDTVEKHLNRRNRVDSKISELVSENNNYCKVLDPACGSGIFLVETLRKIIERFIKETGVEAKSDYFKEAIVNLARENIYGIDKDASAVQVAVFSIYLTLLDYLEPPSIENFKFPILYNTNFFEADFFDEESSFNQALSEVDFNFILGNPPWMRGKGDKKKPLYVQYIDKRRKKEKGVIGHSIDIGNREIAQAFILRSSDFSKDMTQCALIVTSKVLYNLQSKNFRQYFLQSFFVNQIFELAPVRREVFDKSNDKAIAPAAVLFFTYANKNETDHNIITHISLKPSRFFSLFKIFTLNRTDYKQIQQNRLKIDDWLWKILVYGTFLDFNFIKRLKTEFISIDSFLSVNNALVKQGIKRKDGDTKINVEQFIGWDFLDLNKKEIQQYYLSPRHQKWDLKTVGYVYRENGVVCQDVFSPPMLLVKETVNTKLESVAAVSNQNIIFTDKTTSIKFRNVKDIANYQLLAGLMNSSLFAYYVLNTSSTAGIMIEQQINDFERFSFPFVSSEQIVNTVSEIEILKKNSSESILEDDSKYNQIEQKKMELNQLIFHEFNLTEQELSLVDYTTNVTIPLSMKHKGHETFNMPIQYESLYLNGYLSAFNSRFSSKDVSKKFVMEVWHTSQVLGVLFRLVSSDNNITDTIWKNKHDEQTEILSFLTQLGAEKITDKLFVQKDIRGFEKDFFYVFKPNEKRLWHSAIGYVDANEFADAILKEGRSSL